MPPSTATPLLTSSAEYELLPPDDSAMKQEEQESPQQIQVQKLADPIINPMKPSSQETS